MNTNIILKDGDKRTILHICTSNGSLKGVKLLLKHGANVYQGDDTLLSPVHAAVLCGYPEMVDLFIDHGKPSPLLPSSLLSLLITDCLFSFIVGPKYCYVADMKGNNPLHIAAIHNRSQEARAILACLANKGDPNDMNEVYLLSFFLPSLPSPLPLSSFSPSVLPSPST